jgi:hypothetical protein
MLKCCVSAEQLTEVRRDKADEFYGRKHHGSKTTSTRYSRKERQNILSFGLGIPTEGWVHSTGRRNRSAQPQAQPHSQKANSGMTTGNCYKLIFKMPF